MVELLIECIKLLVGAIFELATRLEAGLNEIDRMPLFKPFPLLDLGQAVSVTAILKGIT